MILSLSLTQAELDRLIRAKLPETAEVESITLEQAPIVRVKLAKPLPVELLAKVEVRTE